VKLLRELLERYQDVDLKKFSQAESDLAPVEGGVEEVVGVLSDDLKRMYIAVRRFYDENMSRCKEVHDQLEEMVSKKEPLDEKDLLFVQAHMLDHKKRDFVMTAFWIAVREAFPKTIFKSDNVGIRDGWKVVTWSDSDRMAKTLRDSLDAFLKK